MPARAAAADRGARAGVAGRGSGADEASGRAPRAAAAPAELIDELRRLSDAHERLLAAVRELLASYEGAARTPEPTALHAVRVAAGPLASPNALRAFERALADVPGVRTVELRGYQGDDRAVVEVQLEPTS